MNNDWQSKIISQASLLYYNKIYAGLAKILYINFLTTYASYH